MHAAVCKPWSAAGSTDQGNRAFEHAGPSTWNALPNTFKIVVHFVYLLSEVI